MKITIKQIPNILTALRLMMVPFIIALILISYYVEIKGFQTPNWKWVINIGNYHLPIMFLTAGVLFLIASFTDFLDGYIARKYEAVSDFGKFFDPIADKLLVNSVLILFGAIGIIPIWITLILILRDVFVDFIRMLLAKKNVTLAADWFGKLKTIFQMIGLTVLFFVNFMFFNSMNNIDFANEYGWFNQVLMIQMYIATAFSLFSGANYFWKAKKSLFKSK